MIGTDDSVISEENDDSDDNDTFYPIDVILPSLKNDMN